MEKREEKLREAAEKACSERYPNLIKYSNTYKYSVDLFIDIAKSEAVKEYHQTPQLDLTELRKEFEKWYLEHTNGSIIMDYKFGHNDIFNFFTPLIQQQDKSDAINKVIKCAEDLLNRTNYLQGNLIEKSTNDLHNAIEQFKSTKQTSK